MKTNTGRICPDCAEWRRKEFQKKLGDNDIPVGVWAKLGITEGTAPEITEYLWVKVIKKLNTPDYYTGIIDNDPVLLTKIKCGDQITFQKKSVHDIYPKTV